MVKVDLSLNHNVPVLEVQGVNEQDESTESVSSRHGQLGNTTEDQSVEVMADGLVVRGPPGFVTQFSESHLSHAFRLPFNRQGSPLCDLQLHVGALAVPCELVPNALDVGDSLRPEWRVKGVHAHAV